MTAPTTALSDFIAGLDLAAIPSATADRAAQHTLDIVADLCASRDVPEAVSIGRLLPDTAAAWSGRVAMFSHATEWDPIHGKTAICAGAIAVPAVLGIARCREVDGPTAVSAIVAGYETAIRIGGALGSSRLLPQGWWPTALCGGAGAAAAAAKALGLGAPAIRDAIAMALVQAGGLSTGGPEAPEARNLLCANTVRIGIEAAEAAASGIRGPAEPLTGERGFLKAFGIEPDEAALLEAIGKRWTIDETTLKAFPCALQAQSALDALYAVLRTHELQQGDIRAIEFALPGPMRQIVDRPGMPGSRFAAAASLQFLAAAMIVDGNIVPHRLGKQGREDAAITEISKTVAVAHDPDLDKHYPEIWPARVRVRSHRDVYEAGVDAARGHPDRPIDLAETTAKFRTFGPKDAEGLERQILNLPRLRNVGGLADAVAGLLPG